ncbi:MAG: ABC transporter substrate-binding protein, partial [Nitriliruptoraceae bacterium]
DETIHESIYVYDFFEDYWAPETVGPERIEMVIILENESRYNAVVSGDVDVASVELPTVAQAEAAGLEVVTWPALRHGLNFIDLNGVFADEDVRKAICYGINFDEINAAQYDGYSQWHAQRHNPGQVGYVDSLPGYPYDQDLALEHMEAAGNPDVTFSLPAAGSQATQAQLFRQQMADIGITVEIDDVTSPQYFSTYQSGDYDAYFNTSSAEDTGPPGLYHFRWTPNGTANPLNNSVPELDEIIERGFAAETLDAQTEIWEEFTQTVYDMALACGFYDLPHAAIWDGDRVENVRGQVWFPSHLRYRDIRVLD